MRASAIGVVAAGLTFLVIGNAAAHHAFAAEFDANKPIVLKGKVTKTEWVNPHSWVHVDVKGDDGKTVNWAIECGAPNALLRRGWNKNSLPVGADIVVDGYKAKDGSTTISAKDITTPDGQKMFVGSSGTGAPYEQK